MLRGRDRRRTGGAQGHGGTVVIERGAAGVARGATSWTGVSSRGYHGGVEVDVEVGKGDQSEGGRGFGAPSGGAWRHQPAQDQRKRKPSQALANLARRQIRALRRRNERALERISTPPRHMLPSFCTLIIEWNSLFLLLCLKQQENSLCLPGAPSSRLHGVGSQLETLDGQEGEIDTASLHVQLFRRALGDQRGTRGRR